MSIHQTSSNSRIFVLQEAVARVVDEQLDTVLVRGTEMEEALWKQIEPALPSGAADLLRPSHPFLDDWDAMDEPITLTPPESNSPDADVGSSDTGGPAAMPTAESRSSAALVQLRGAVIELQVRPQTSGRPRHVAHPQFLM